MTVTSYRPEAKQSPVGKQSFELHALLSGLARRGRLLTGADVAAVVSLAREGLRVVATDPPGASPSPNAVVGLPQSMLPVAGLLARGLLRWSRMPAGSDYAHAALVALPSNGAERYLMMIATRDRTCPFEEPDLLILGHLAVAAITERP